MKSPGVLLWKIVEALHWWVFVPLLRKKQVACKEFDRSDDWQKYESNKYCKYTYSYNYEDIQKTV